MMKVILVVLSFFILSNCNNKNNIKHYDNQIAYISIDYMSLLSCYYIPKTPKTIYSVKNELKNKIITNTTCLDSFNVFLRNLEKNKKAQYQDEVDPRLIVNLIFKDSTKKTIFLEGTGFYMIDSTRTVYISDTLFLKYISKLINSPDEIYW